MALCPPRGVQSLNSLTTHHGLPMHRAWGGRFRFQGDNFRGLSGGAGEQGSARTLNHDIAAKAPPHEKSAPRVGCAFRGENLAVVLNI